MQSLGSKQRDVDDFDGEGEGEAGVGGSAAGRRESSDGFLRSVISFSKSFSA